MKKKLIIAASLATAGALAVAGTVMADDRDGRGMGMGMGGGRGDRPFLGGILLLVAAAAAVGLGVWLFMRRRPALALAGAPVTAPFVAPTATAESILAERLARSEINPDEYRVSLAALRESASGTAPVAPWSPVPPADAAAGDGAGEATSEDGANS